jgi:hypothetical protein
MEAEAEAAEAAAAAGGGGLHSDAATMRTAVETSCIAARHPPLLDIRVPYTRAVTFRDGGDLLYHSPLSRIASHYSPQVRASLALR